MTAATAGEVAPTKAASLVVGAVAEKVEKHAGPIGDAVAAVTAFEEWRSRDGEPIRNSECIAYKVPLFLGGADSIENMERMNLEVYWETCAQLLAQSDRLPDGTPIGGISNASKSH